MQDLVELDENGGTVVDDWKITLPVAEKDDLASLFGMQDLPPFASDSSIPLPREAAGKASPFVYDWNKPQRSARLDPMPLIVPDAHSIPEAADAQGASAASSLVDHIFETGPADARSATSTMSKLSKELERVKAEHQDINAMSDEISRRGQYGVSLQFQISALKKRKLALKDRMAALEAQLESLLRRSIMEGEEQEANQIPRGGGGGSGADTADPVGTTLGQMMRRLSALGLRPQPVPPHLDSFFLSLMKALQAAGLRPQGYDFREGPVMGADRQFPNAAKKAKLEVLKLLSSQADKLNGIGGWRLSPEEFRRYFAKAWWTLPAARDDLFMASAHLYSVRIVALSLEPGGLDEQVHAIRVRASVSHGG